MTSVSKSKTGIRNILFIMADQLRWDYLGCAGHRSLETPAIDSLAARGTRFTNAYVQSAICGPSRMSFYTGLYVSNHGSTGNSIPLAVGTRTLGDYLRPLGVKTALAGKTHMRADKEGIDRLGVGGIEGQRAAECGFDPYVRDDGLHPTESIDPDLQYNAYLRSHGYTGENPWHDFANAAEGPNGDILTGWIMRNAHLPARVRAEHSETPWMTDQAIRFMEDQGDEPWCLHLSYIKPHWPYMAPAPYHNMYGRDDLQKPVRSEGEKTSPHPVVERFMQHEESVNFSKDSIREHVVPTYMGLIRQIDDSLGRLFARMEELGRWEDTLVVFTSDHGDYLGDHWLGEKELFHDTVAKVPMIIAAPNGLEGQENDSLVEAIDLIPTFIDAVGGDVPTHQLDGRSLMPTMRGTPDKGPRDFAVAELDYSQRQARRDLNLDVNTARAWMVRTMRWKYIEYLGFRPQLFDMEADPNELRDLGDDPAYGTICTEMRERLFQWFATRKVRRTLPDDRIETLARNWKGGGVILGEW